MDTIYITNGVTQDGFGARLQRSLGVLAYSLYLRDKYVTDVKYIHTPFTYEGFGENFTMGEQARSVGDNKEPYDENSREGYLKRAKLWDDTLSYDGIRVTDIDLGSLKVLDITSKDKSTLEHDILKGLTTGKLYIIKGLQGEFNTNKIDYDIITKYYSEINEHFKFIIPTDNNDIRIHIRRKDAEKFKLERYIDNSYYLSILDIIKPYKEKYNVTIHTQRKGFTPSEFEDWNIVYDDEEEDYELFIKMVNSKVLVMGKSSFSLVAGMLNQNVVIYPTQPQKALSRWTNKEQLKDILKNGI